MEENGCNYLGDYFYKMYKEKGNSVRIRTRYTDREQHYKKEFLAICESNLDEFFMVRVGSLERALTSARALRTGVKTSMQASSAQKNLMIHPPFPAKVFRTAGFLCCHWVQRTARKKCELGTAVLPPTML